MQRMASACALVATIVMDLCGFDLCGCSASLDFDRTYPPLPDAAVDAALPDMAVPEPGTTLGNCQLQCDAVDACFEHSERCAVYEALSPGVKTILNENCVKDCRKKGGAKDTDVATLQSHDGCVGFVDAIRMAGENSGLAGLRPLCLTRTETCGFICGFTDSAKHGCGVEVDLEHPDRCVAPCVASSDEVFGCLVGGLGGSGSVDERCAVMQSCAGPPGPQTPPSGPATAGPR